MSDNERYDEEVAVVNAHTHTYEAMMTELKLLIMTRDVRVVNMRRVFCF